jgi:diguanylate cyclase (GGDEF)-like protein
LLMHRQTVHAQRMRDLAMTDELTRLPNRRHLMALADAQVERGRRDGVVFCILALDIDHFKRVNDNYGHDAGDVVLQRFARACRDALRASDVIGRTGGEEFIALLPATPLQTALEVAERVRIAVMGVDVRDVHPELRLTVSIGVAEWRADDRNFSTQAKRADDALYSAKEGGRNRAVAA